MNKTAKLKISIVIVISIVAGLIAIEHLDKSWRNSDDWYNSSESVRNSILFLINVLLLPLLIIVIYSLFCTIQAVLYPFISRYAYFLYFSDFRYELVKGRSGVSAWFWVKKDDKLTIEVGHHGHMADRNLKFRNKLTFYFDGIDFDDKLFVVLTELIRNEAWTNGDNVNVRLLNKFGPIAFDIYDYFDTSNYENILKVVDKVIKQIKE